MEDTHIPDRAASWIISHLRSAKIEVSENREELIRSSSCGLAALTVKELKLVAKQLAALHKLENECSISPGSSRFHKPLSNAKKAEWVKCIQKCFYLDDMCKVPAKESDPIWRLIESKADTNDNTKSDGGVSGNAHTPKPQQHQQGPVPEFLALQSPSGNGVYTKPETPNSTFTSSAARGSRKRRYPDAFSQSKEDSKPNGMNGNIENGTYKSALAKVAADQIKVKLEKIDYDYARRFIESNSSMETTSPRSDRFETRPRDIYESNYVGQLKGMGFTDMREMLSGIRHVQNTGSSNVIEDAMMWIVTQREEEDEARKLDAARISSEYALTEEQQRKKDADKELRNTSLNDILNRQSEFFPSSILLQCSSVISLLRKINGARGKDLVIRYLTLEKRAQKWYGTVVPWAYFYYVARERIIALAGDLDKSIIDKEKKSSPSEYLCTKLCVEVDKLEAALYSLSEQEEGGVGRVPKIFLVSRQDATNKGLPIAPRQLTATGDCGDDVIVLESQECKANKNIGDGNARKKCRHSLQLDDPQSKDPKVEDIEVIEIE